MLKISQFTLALLSAATLVACGGGSNTTTTTTTPTPVTPTSSAVTLSTSYSNQTVVSPNGTTVLTVTIKNTGGTASVGGIVNIALPTGLKSSSQFAVGSPCTNSGYVLGSAFMLTGVTVPAGATCTNAITLTPTSAGTFIATNQLSIFDGVTPTGTQATLTIQ
jgi:hypothetical protein